MSAKPKALALADAQQFAATTLERELAAELRRLSALNAQLLEALRDLADDIAGRFDMDSPSTNPGMRACVAEARAAIKAAEAE